MRIHKQKLIEIVMSERGKKEKLILVQRYDLNVLTFHFIISLVL